MLHVLFPLPEISGEDIIQNQLRALYNLNHGYLSRAFADMAQGNKFSYNGKFYGYRYGVSEPLPEGLFPQMNKLLYQLEKWNKEYRILRSFLLRMDLEGTYIRNLLPPLMGGNGDESDIPEIRLMYARILKNKLLE